MSLATRLGASSLAFTGLGLTLCGQPDLWLRLTGLQTLMMGIYLIALSFDPNPHALRLLLRTRMLLLAAILVWWSLTPSSNWWLLSPLLEGTWLAITQCQHSPKTAHKPLITKGFTSTLHNLGLGIIPLGEGLGALLLASLYGPLALGVETLPEDLPSAALFGLHTLYLAWFWLVIVRARARRAMAATAWGRAGVALAFVVFTLTGIVTADAHLIYLAPLLVCSALWTGLELRFGPVSSLLFGRRA